MKTIDLRAATPSVQELLELASEGNLILRAPGGKEFLLAEVDDFSLEVALVREQPELMALLDERSRESGTLNLDQVRQSLG